MKAAYLPALVIALVIVLSTVPACAQRGDHKGQVQPSLPASLKIPPAPVLAPRDGLKSLRVQPGFEVQLVAAKTVRAVRKIHAKRNAEPFTIKELSQIE